MTNPQEIARIACSEHHASQRVDELADAIALIDSIRPEIVVEIGCDAGGTLYAWRQVCDEVYGITLADNSWPTGGQSYPLVDHGATVFRSDSRSPESLGWLLERLTGRAIDVLHIDGDHSYDGVRADYEMYAPLVRSGGLVLIHDVLNRWDSRVDVMRFWDELTATHQCTQVITSRRSRPVGFGVITMEGTP